MALPTRLFVIGATCIFGMLVLHNAVNLDVPTRERRRDLPAGFAAERQRRRRELQLSAGARVPGREGSTQGAAVSVGSDVVPWRLPRAPRGPFNYSDCTARVGALGPTRELEYIVPRDSPNFPANCDREDLKELCGIVRRVAINREVLTAVCNSKIITQLKSFLEARGVRGCSGPHGSHPLMRASAQHALHRPLRLRASRM